MTTKRPEKLPNMQSIATTIFPGRLSGQNIIEAQCMFIKAINIGTSLGGTDACLLRSFQFSCQDLVL